VQPKRHDGVLNILDDSVALQAPFYYETKYAGNVLRTSRDGYGFFNSRGGSASSAQTPSTDTKVAFGSQFA
jgi:hypothetical protein